MRHQPLLQQAERGGGIVGEPEQFEIFATDGAVPHQRLEVDDLLPVLRSVEQYRDRAIQLLRLLQGQYLHHLVERAEAAGKNHQRARQMGEPQLAHEKIVKLERQAARDVRIGPLLVRQTDIQADRSSARFGRAAIGRLHDAGAAAGADHVAVTIRPKPLRPGGDQFAPARARLRSSARAGRPA